MVGRNLHRRGALGAAAATLPILFAAGPAAAQAVQWAEQPSVLDLRAAYPKKALTEGVDARVLLKCDVAADGRLEACGVAGEEPNGYGFGASAVMLAPKFKVAMNGAIDPGGTLTIPLRFEPPAGVPPMREAVFKKPTGDYRKLIPAGPYWPERALRQGKGGEAVVDCVVEDNGRLSACQHVSGEPDFGGSTLRMAAAGWMTAAPAPAGAAPADHVWRFHVVFPAKRIKDTAPPGG